MASSEFEALLEHIRASRGFDFTGYKPGSLERRIRKRMEGVGIDSLAAYQDHLEADADEFAFLFNTILINVTAFFRDPEAWRHLAESVLPGLLAKLPSDRPLRVWCAGCASGEETYTLAILLAEALGEREYLDRVKIYATDADEEALAEARAASYSARTLEGVPEALRDRYFDRVEQRYVFRKDLRRAVIFGRNDLVQDAPISRVDLLSCRNTLMYFNAETQARVLARFFFALNDDGYLLLGRSEMLLSQAQAFTPVTPNQRLFTKVPANGDGRVRLRPPAVLEHDAGTRAEALELAPVAQVVLDANDRVLMVNRAGRELFGLSARDAGRPLKDLELSYRPVELRGPIETAVRERRVVHLGVVALVGSGVEHRHLDVSVVPLLRGAEVSGVSVVFHDVTRQRHLQAELEDSTRGLEAAYEELQSTVEELETTNEELQSANEELETTNEELQSANEELETINEELQSANEELETTNEELRKRTRDLDELNVFFETVLTSMGLAIAVVDAQLRVTAWNRLATELWGLTTREVLGQYLLNLDIGLPVDRLHPPLRTVLAEADAREVLELDAVNRRGRTIRCHITCLSLRNPDATLAGGAVILMETSA